MNLITGYRIEPMSEKFSKRNDLTQEVSYHYPTKREVIKLLK